MWAIFGGALHGAAVRLAVLLAPAALMVAAALMVPSAASGAPEEAAPPSARGRARGQAPAASCGGEESRDVIASVTPEGDLRLGSGKLVALSSLRLPDEPEAGAARAWLARHTGKPARVVAARREDRWGRTSARVMVQAEAPPGAGSKPEAVSLDLAQGLMEEGLALVDVGAGEALCQPELLAIEATAREGGLGLWAGDRYKPLPSEDAERLRGRVGRFGLIEGRVASVGERPQRTYLNLATAGAEQVTVTIPKRTWAIMVDKGFSAAGLKGRRIRVRGLIEDWRGVAVDVAVAELIEILDRERRRR